MIIAKITILVADDHLMVRQGLVVLLNAQTDFEVVGEAGDGHEMLQLAESRQPSVILADINMPNLNGIEATSLVRRRYPEIHVVLLSDRASSFQVIRALRNGALGYLVRSDDFQQVVLAVKAVSLGRRYLSGPVADQIIDAVVAGENIDQDRLDDKISVREREILQLIAEGNTSAQIGEKLVISTRTVETHRTNIMKKLGLTSQVDLVRFAVRYGLITID